MAVQFTDGRFHADNAQGAPLVGGRLYTYESGTTTFKTAYATVGTSTPATYVSDGLGGQYIELNARGEEQVWLSDGLYTCILKDASGVTMWSVDGVTSVDTGGGGGGGGGSGVSVVVMGDSQSAENAMPNESWPAIFQTQMNALNAQVTVHNLAKNGWTFNRANTVDMSGGMTMVEAAIALNPAVVIVQLGANDAVIAVDGRTSVQQMADATACFAALRAGLPDAVLVYGSEVVFDIDNFPTPGVTLKNKGVLPNLWQLKTSGILQDMITPEALEDGVSSTMRARHDEWTDLDAIVKALSTVDEWFTVPYWKAARLGMVGADGVHLTALGQRFLAAAVVKYCQASTALIPLFPNLANQDYLPWNDPDNYFIRFLTDSGDGYVNAAYDVEAVQVSKQAGLWNQTNPAVWFYRSKAMCKFFPLTFNADSFNIPYWEVRNARPNTLVEVSVGGGPFATAGQSTDDYGNAMFPTSGANSAPGALTLRYRVGNEVFGPFVLSIGASAEPSMLARLVSSQSTGAADSYITVLFNSEIHDIGAGYNPGTGAYTAPRAGRYLFTTNVTIGSLPAGGSIFVQFRKNGSAHLVGPFESNGLGGSSVQGTSLAASIALAAGDTVDVQLYNFNSSPLSIITGTGNTATWLTAEYLGR